MKKFNYKEIGKEIGWNFAKMNYSVDHLSEYDYYKEVVNHITPTTKMLDIGCGSAEKTTRFYSIANKIYLTDFEPEMLKKAKKNVEKYYEGLPNTKKKFIFGILDCNGPFNFPDNSFDLVVSRHCGANMKEVFRVLKKGGAFISEDYSSYDCQEIKELFNRGQNFNREPLFKKVMNECLDAGFSEIKYLKFEEIEYYKTIDDLKYLLTHTPILDYYDEKQDDKILKKYVDKFLTSKGIKLNRRLDAFTIKK